MIWRLAIALAILFSLIQAAPLTAQEDMRAALQALQQDDRRLQSVGWQLAKGNAAFCEDAAPGIGLLLQDMAGYGKPDRLRAAAGISGDIAVQAVARSSPAETAGLRSNAEILAIEGFRTSGLPRAGEQSWQRLTGLHARIDAALADGTITLAWRDSEGAEVVRNIAGVPVCRTRFELLDEGEKAAADGTRVVIGREFAGMSYAEEEFAAALAHELAHNVLGHRAWLEKVGRAQSNVRLTEREADRLMPWLLANAGYDPESALRFMQRWGPRHGGGLFRKRTHDGWDERAEFIRAELPAIRAAMARDGAADWSRLFRRQIPG